MLDKKTLFIPSFETSSKRKFRVVQTETPMVRSRKNNENIPAVAYDVTFMTEGKNSFNDLTITQ